MKRLDIKVIALAISFAFCTNTMAQNISKNDYSAEKNKIEAEYKLSKEHCASLSGNQNDICTAEVKGKEKIAIAELEARYKPNRKNHYNARVAKAEADYGVASARCNEKAGNANDVCMKEAKAIEVAAKANAKTQIKTSDANATATKESNDAHNKAKEKTNDALKDSATKKRDAEYDIAKEKCGMYAGNAKDHCLDEAKTQFGK